MGKKVYLGKDSERNASSLCRRWGTAKMNLRLKVIVAGIIFLGVILRIFLAFLPIDMLIGWFLYDDAFYYFKVAQNIIAGLGSTFDGVNKTNGYHPLWMLVNLMAFVLLKNPEHSIELLLLFASVLDMNAGAVLSLLAFKLAKDVRVIPFALTLWLLNQRVLSATFTGLETALSMLAIALLFLAFYSVTEQPTIQRVVLFGIASGSAFLARTDNIILIVVLFTLLFVAVRRISFVMVALLIVIGLAAPWLLWNWLTFRSIIQDSAIALKGFEIAQLSATGQSQSIISFILHTLMPKVFEHNRASVCKHWLASWPLCGHYGDLDCSGCSDCLPLLTPFME